MLSGMSTDAAFHRPQLFQRSKAPGGAVHPRGRSRGETGRFKFVLAAIGFISWIAAVSSAFAQVPAPVPALPDTERRTSYSISGTTCACAINFQLYGDGVDFANWVEVFLNGTRVNFNDATFGWTITSPSGPIGNLARPITNAVLTFNSVQTGTVQIVGARRPRRTSQFSESAGVPARNINQVVTDITATLRELWDKDNDMTGRGLFSQPGVTLGPLPLPSACANGFLGFDATGLIPQCRVGAGAGNMLGPLSATLGNAAVFGATPNLLTDAGSPPFNRSIFKQPHQFDNAGFDIAIQQNAVRDRELEFVR
jgi:hypothetical protein